MWQGGLTNDRTKTCCLWIAKESIRSYDQLQVICVHGLGLLWATCLVTRPGETHWTQSLSPWSGVFFCFVFKSESYLFPKWNTMDLASLWVGSLCFSHLCQQPRCHCIFFLTLLLSIPRRAMADATMTFILQCKMQWGGYRSAYRCTMSSRQSRAEPDREQVSSLSVIPPTHVTTASSQGNQTATTDTLRRVLQGRAVWRIWKGENHLPLWECSIFF